MTCIVQVSLVNNTNLIGISRSGLSDTYNLAKFNFHWGSVDSVGSEHTLNRRAFPMEVSAVSYEQIADEVGYTSGRFQLPINTHFPRLEN